MLKRLAFVAGFGAGFVVGSASGRKSFESLRDTALSTWNDPKVQEKVSEGSDWVKSEVPVVGDKLADSAQKAADSASSSAQRGAAAAKGKAQEGAAAAKGKAQEGAAAAKGKAQQGAAAAGSDSSSDHPDLPEPATTEKNVKMTPAHPEPNPEDMNK